MATIKINYTAVLNASGKCDTAKQNVQNTKDKVNSINNTLDSQIRQRANIANRLNNVSNNLSDIKSRINSIQNVCNNAARGYQNLDGNLSNKAAKIDSSMVSKFK